MAPSTQGQERERECPRDGLDHPPRAERRQHAGQLVEPGRVDAADPTDDGVVRDCHRDGGAVQAVVEDGERGDDRGDEGQQPSETGGAEMVGQGSRGTGWATSCHLVGRRRLWPRHAGQARIRDDGVAHPASSSCCTCAQCMPPPW